MIHATAVINKKAVLADDVEIGAYAVIDGEVKLGRGVKICSHVHIKGKTVIGDDTFIGVGAVIGEVPQMLGMKEALGRVHIGKNNIIREYVTINCSISDDKTTSLGDNNLLMAFSHIAHDCRLANNIVVCNGSLLAGHIEVANRAFVSGNVVVHQFVRIGRLAMIGGLSRVNQDVPPFMMVLGDSCVRGLNIVGLKRSDFSRKEISNIKKAHTILYRKDLALKSALSKLKEIESGPVKEMIVFILSSKRGICGPKRSTLWERIFLDYPYLLRTRIPAYDFFKKAKNKA